MQSFSKKEWTISDKKHFGGRFDYHPIEGYIRAQENNIISGILHYKIQAGVMDIVSFIVGVDYQKKGIGRALIKSAEELAKKNKVHKLYLLTGIDWEAAQFYEKVGFIQTGILKNHHMNKDWIEFSKFL